jgi:hypothetical protein
VDLYDSTVAVRWRVAPEPDIAAVFSVEEAQLVRDIQGTEEWAGQVLRNKAHRRLRMMKLYRFELSDDTGTEYVPRGGGAGGLPGSEMTGEARFVPAVPASVTELTFSWLNASVRVPLAAG